MSTDFKHCPGCNVTWASREDFLSDSGVNPIGYQVDFVDLASGMFLFNHACSTTFALPVGSFRCLYDGPVFVTRATGTDACPGHCLRRNELESCPTSCECAYVREILQAVRRWPKKPGGRRSDAGRPVSR